jgi:DNA-binding NarL/FixJ family response regulator
MSAPRVSERQVETLQLLAAGRSSRAIAQALRSSESTAKRDISELLQLFDAANRTALVTAATSLGFIRRLPKEP